MHAPATTRHSTRKRPAHRVMVLGLTLVTLVGGLFVTASAPTAAAPVGAVGDAPAFVGSPEGAGGDYQRVRDGWGVRVTATVSAPPNGCGYIEVKLRVDGGRDPDQKIVRTCDGEVLTRTRTIDAQEGFTLQDIVVKLCTERTGPDSCQKVTDTIPDQPGVATPDQVADVTEIMELPMADFQAMKLEQPAPFNWTDDNCSAPQFARVWKQRFRKACERHDFGYRNFGKNSWAPVDVRRAYVDSRFLTEMRALCQSHSWSRCRSWSGAFYTAVRTCGGPAFYRESYEACSLP